MSKNAHNYENYKKTLNSRNVILLVKAGSELIGMSSKDSDIDEIGVCLENPEDLLGFTSFEQTIYRTAEDREKRADAKSGPGDIDLTIYGLRKYLRLAMNGNPTILNLLYAPDDKCLIKTFIGSELQRLTPKIISRRAGSAFLGYMQAQRLRLTGERGQMRVNRPEVVAEYGFDTKYAAHVIRLALQGLTLLRTGKLTLPMSGTELKLIKQVRNGEYSLNNVLALSKDYEADIKSLLDSSPLPKNPDYHAIQNWLLTTYHNAWKDRKYEEVQLQEPMPEPKPEVPILEDMDIPF